MFGILEHELVQAHLLRPVSLARKLEIRCKGGAPFLLGRSPILLGRRPILLGRLPILDTWDQLHMPALPCPTQSPFVRLTQVSLISLKITMRTISFLLALVASLTLVLGANESDAVHSAALMTNVSH